MSDLKHLYANQEVATLLPDEYFTRGFIFAVATAPDIPLPEVWMPWLIQGQGNTLSTHIIDNLADGLMNTLRDCLQNMRDENKLLPEGCKWAKEKAGRRNLEHWLTGLLEGHRQLEPCWQKAWKLAQEKPEKAPLATGEDPAKRLRRCLKLFTLLADVELAKAARDEAQVSALEDNLPILYKQLPSMLAEYVRLAGELAQALPNQFEMFNPPK
ncbi:UPF0149 family protein [Alteromonas pelagimontana]|uniref:UPF0149 family protein n=1 Tax=Alteromonas pelagimontana TaxID=1858656 RepID=A0A6M4MAC9_9ALTE|nr:UPF0149 family protein [Alteromonas pelagimontana]QJR80124.1 UPF0149 family protein [Alteromonas pelagimontana]